MNIKRVAGIVIFIGCFMQTIHGQVRNPLPDGNPRINKAAVMRANRFRLSSPNTLGSVNYLVRVYFHIVTNDDGSNAPITAAQIVTEFNTLLASYAADNICFLNAGTDVVKNTFLNTLFNADSDPGGTFFLPYQVPNCINIFYTQTIKGNNDACSPPCSYGGIALGGIPGTFFLVSKGNIGAGESISHEMGHNLGLFHTFETVNGYESINGSNAAYAGDQVTDTPADPMMFHDSSCYQVTPDKCHFLGICVDSNNEILYKAPYTNLMAYWWRNGCYSGLSLTNGQYARVNSFLGSYLPLIGCSSPADVVQTGISVSSGYYMNSALNSFTTSGSVTFSGTARGTMGGNRVQLNPGFRASPGAGGIVRIEAKPCN